MSKKGSSSTTQVHLPASLEQGANEVLAAGMRSASLPYSPNRGITVAAFAPQQVSAMQGTNAMANAYGLGSTGTDLGITHPGTNAFNMKGYNTAGLFDEMQRTSTSPRYRAEHSDILAGYRNAAGRIYKEANINPADRGVNPSAKPGRR